MACRSARGCADVVGTVAVVGLGLIGGSLAMAWSAAGIRVLGVEKDADTARQALQAGAVASLCPPDGISEAQAVVLAMAPHACIAFLREYAAVLPRGAVVTDVCGVKQAVVAACEALCRPYGLRFVGGHPMAGKEHNGFGNAQADLFEGASYILTPTDQTEPAALDTVRDLALAAGCDGCTYTTPEEHDRRIAFTSQLPHVLAGAYVRSPQWARHTGFSAGSYRDVSRVAAVDETLWSELFLQNRQALCEEIGGLVERLSAMQKALEEENTEKVAGLIRAGREAKEQLSE